MCVCVCVCEIGGLPNSTEVYLTKPYQLHMMINDRVNILSFISCRVTGMPKKVI